MCSHDNTRTSFYDNVVWWCAVEIFVCVCMSLSLCVSACVRACVCLCVCIFFSLEVPFRILKLWIVHAPSFWIAGEHGNGGENMTRGC